MAVPSYGPLLAACIGMPSLAAGALLVMKSRSEARIQGPERASDFLVAGVSLLVLAAFAFSAGAYAWYEERVSEGTLHFTYQAVLEPNGTGLTRVSLPIPVPEDLIAGHVVSPSSSSAAINRSGPEPSLDVVFSERTTVSASFVGYRPNTGLNLTFSSEFPRCLETEQCESDLNLTIVEGAVREVRVQLTVEWGYPCDWPEWRVVADAQPGRHSYPAETPMLVC